MSTPHERFEFEQDNGLGLSSTVEVHKWVDNFRDSERAAVLLKLIHGAYLSDGTGRFSDPVTLSLSARDAAQLGRALISAARQGVIEAHNIPYIREGG